MHVYFVVKCLQEIQLHPVTALSSISFPIFECLQDSTYYFPQLHRTKFNLVLCSIILFVVPLVGGATKPTNCRGHGSTFYPPVTGNTAFTGATVKHHTTFLLCTTSRYSQTSGLLINIQI